MLNDTDCLAFTLSKNRLNILHVLFDILLILFKLVVVNVPNESRVKDLIILHFELVLKWDFYQGNKIKAQINCIFLFIFFSFFNVFLFFFWLFIFYLILSFSLFLNTQDLKGKEWS